MPSAVFNIIWPCIEVIVYLFHSLMLILLIWGKNTKFNGPFFDIFRILMVADLIYYFTLNVGTRFPRWGFFIEFYLTHDFLATIVLNILSYIALVQFVGHCFLSFNRFILLLFPSKYSKFWEYQWYTVIIIILPFFHVCYRLTAQAKYSILGTGQVYTNWTNQELYSITTKISSMIYIIATCLEGIFSVLSIIKYYSLGYSASSKIKIMEIRLLFISCIIFIAQLIRSIYSFMLPYFAGNESYIDLAALVPVVVDIGAWSRSVSLILLSSTARKAFANMYFPWSEKSVIHVASTNVHHVTKIT